MWWGYPVLCSMHKSLKGLWLYFVEVESELSSDGCGSGDCASFGKANGCLFESWSGHMPEFQILSLVQML